jgi:hypothetical protein
MYVVKEFGIENNVSSGRKGEIVILKIYSRSLLTITNCNE